MENKIPLKLICLTFVYLLRFCRLSCHIMDFLSAVSKYHGSSTSCSFSFRGDFKWLNWQDCLECKVAWYKQVSWKCMGLGTSFETLRIFFCFVANIIFISKINEAFFKKGVSIKRLSIFLHACILPWSLFPLPLCRHRGKGKWDQGSMQACRKIDSLSIDTPFLKNASLIFEIKIIFAKKKQKNFLSVSKLEPTPVHLHDTCLYQAILPIKPFKKGCKGKFLTNLF